MPIPATLPNPSQANLTPQATNGVSPENSPHSVVPAVAGAEPVPGKPNSPIRYWINGFLQYFDLRGCASRAEFWWFMVLPCVAIVPVALGYVFDFVAPQHAHAFFLWGGIISLLAMLCLIVPCFSITVRRLHDTGKSAWWLLGCLLPAHFGTLFFFYLTLGISKTQGNKYRGEEGSSADAAELADAPPARFTPFYLYWLISLRRLTTFKGRAGAAEFWSFFVLSNILFMSFAYCMVDTYSMPIGHYMPLWTHNLLYLDHLEDALMLVSHACVNPTFGMVYQFRDLSETSVILLVISACLNIAFTMAVGVRRLHDANLSGYFILLPLVVFAGTFGALFTLYVDSYASLPYLSGIDTLLNVLDIPSLAFLAMMCLKGSPGGNKYGSGVDSITIP